MRNRTRWLVIGAAALVVVLGGGAALAASGSNNAAADFLGGVADRLGISRDKLEGAIEDETIERIDAAVDAGKLTKEEGDALKDRVRSGDLPPIPPDLYGGSLRFGPTPRMAVPVLPPGPDLLDAAIEYLGIDRADLREAFREGKSLAELAEQKGKSVEGLKEALRSAIREQADRLVQTFSSTVDELVDRRLGLGPKFGMGGRGFEFGPPGPFKRGVIPGDAPGADFMRAAAEYLGIDAADVRDALRHGRSLADLAGDKGKSIEGLKDALRDEIREDADRAVEDGVMTKEQADQFVEKLATAVDELVDTSPRRGWGFDFRSDGGDFELHLRIAPEAPMPPPGAPGGSSVAPAPIPALPI